MHNDAETGLNYNYRRDYDPGLGKYIEADPIGLAGGLNLFVYARNNPLAVVDLTGLEPCKQIGDWKEVAGSSTLCGNSRYQRLWKFVRSDEGNAFRCRCTWQLVGGIKLYDKKCFKEEVTVECKKKDKCGKETTYTKTETRDSYKYRPSTEFEGWYENIPSLIDPTIEKTTLGDRYPGGCGCPNPNVEIGYN